MNQNNRLDKVIQGLTPKQAVVHWLQEIQHFSSVTEFIRFQREQPESEAPITKLTRQVEQTIRISLRGSPKPQVEATVRRAVKDVVFLMKLQLQIEIKVMSELRPWRLSQIALAEALCGLHAELFLRNVITDIADQVNFETPYPLDSQTAEAVEAAIQNHVYTYEALEDEGILDDWLHDYFSRNNAVELPLDSYRYVEGKYTPTITPQNEKAVRTLFKDDAEFELFRSGRDYSFGLANVNDAEYNKHYQTIVNAVQNLVHSSQIQEGSVVSLETVPIPFLQEAPLIDRVWLDRHVLELAEWGALLQSADYQLKNDGDQPLLATVKIVRENGKEADPVEIQTLRQKAIRHLARFRGRTRQINDRTYLHFEDYRFWRGRLVKGDPKSKVKKGLTNSAWNKWVIDHGGESIASVGEVVVELFHCGVDKTSFYACPIGVEEHLCQRDRLLENVRYWHCKTDWKKELINEWKLAVSTVLVELYAFEMAVDHISRNYFAGQPLLFADLAEGLVNIITATEKTIANYNEVLAGILDSAGHIDLESLKRSAKEVSPRQVAYLVDMAKAEALDDLGDREAGIKLAEKYL